MYSGDDRLYQNIFLGGSPEITEESYTGTAGYDKHPSTWEEYLKRIIDLGNEDHEKFKLVPQAVYINGNAYLKDAPAYAQEKDNYVSKADPKVKIVEEADGTYLEMDVEEGVLNIPTQIIHTKMLGMPRITEAPFDAPDGSMIVFDKDILGAQRSGYPTAGPIEGMKAGHNRILVWG